MSAGGQSGKSPGVHPDDATLESWALGVLPLESARRLEAHIELCDECARRLDSIAVKPDPFLQKLRGAAGMSETMQGAAPPAPLSSDADLTFAALAIQAGVITPQQLADACVLWAGNGGVPLADLMVEQGWIDDDARKSLMAQLAAKIDHPSNLAAAETLSSRDPRGLGVDTTTMAPLSTDRLRLLRLHSQGGIGQVWLAKDTLLGREVALKELLPELRGSERHRERFLREARVAAQLSHPGTAPVYEYREEGGRCYYTMRFYSGRTLSEAIQQAHAKRHEAGEANLFERLFPLVEQFQTVCDTVAYAHSKGIIHRDLKGENVVLGEFGEVTVIDWGLAKSINGADDGVTLDRESDDPTKTIEGERLGTPGFMAPEQARGDLASIDERTDVYGLAAVLYEVLTARPPFTGETAREVMQRVETLPPVRPSALHPSTPEDLEAICLKGLSKQRDNRYASAAELGDAVRGWLVHQVQRRADADRRARFFSLSHDLFIAIDDQGAIIQVNPAYESHFAYDKPRQPGQNYLTRVHPDDVEQARSMYENAQATGSQTDTFLRIQGADGVYRMVNWSLTHVPGEAITYGVGRPVDEESRRRRLAEERERFFSLSRDFLVIYDGDFRVAQANKALLEFLGEDEQEVVGIEGLSHVHPDDKPAVRRYFEMVRQDESVQDIVCRVVTKQGKTYPTNWTLSRVPGENTIYAIGRSLDDKSERRREQAARARFFSLSPNLFVISDERGNAAQVNQAWTTLLGWEPEDVIGSPFYDFVHPDDVAKISSAGRRALLREPVTNLEVQMRCKHGGWRPFVWTLTHLPGENINYAIGRETG